jgi:hypothetical protein
MTRLLEGLRLLFGAALVLTALRYFLPPLVPFLPGAEWTDPMAVRLMTAFDRSGLLAVAMFIHLAAGTMLIVSRAVPFALGALLPVNLCGGFISLFVEGGAPTGLLAVLTVAINGLLMLAYLPAYRGVLEPGQLADGEQAEDGRNYESLFVKPFGSAPPGAYPGSALVLAGALAFYWFVIPGLNGLTGLVTLAVPAVLLAIGWACALSRRGA